MTQATEMARARAGIQRVIDAHTDDEGRLRLDPATVERDLARLVLAIMELLRELMELQAIRRLEAGSLSAAQEEALSEALFRSREKLRELAAQFGLSEADLNLGLGLEAQPV